MHTYIHTHPHTYTHTHIVHAYVSTLRADTRTISCIPHVYMDTYTCILYVYVCIYTYMYIHYTYTYAHTERGAHSLLSRERFWLASLTCTSKAHRSSVSPVVSGEGVEMHDGKTHSARRLRCTASPYLRVKGSILGDCWIGRRKSRAGISRLHSVR